MEDNAIRIGEVIEAGTAEFAAQCYELYGLPALGALVRTASGDIQIYGVVNEALTGGVEPGRRPLARGKNAASEEAVYSENPQLSRLLRSEFRALVVGCRINGTLRHYLPPCPARIHGFVYVCPEAEVREFSSSLSFLDTLVNARTSVPVEEVTAAALRQMSLASEDQRAFLVAAGKRLSVALGGDYTRLRQFLARL